MIVGFSFFGILTLLALVVFFGFFSSGDRQALLSSTKTYNHSSEERKYRIYTPKNVNSGTRILFALHGFSDSAWKHAYYTGLHNVANDFIVVYPEATKPNRKGLKTGWNASFCCGSGWVNKVDDIGFLKGLATEVSSKFEQTNQKIFISGFSNGAFMAQRLATEYPEIIDAVAVSSGSIGTIEKRFEPKVPVPILLMHGRNDDIVPFDGGLGKSDPEIEWLPFEVTKRTWEKINGSKAKTDVHIYEEGTHQWNDWRILNMWHQQPEASLRAIEFFRSVN